eukprot:Lithocolla_globosa_v1_NODE_1280_length_2702_cov_40.766528.p1 type:complete len:825 gc:universal NODE_1280_length_2702_cov_40.766528:183-2657(+)
MVSRRIATCIIFLFFLGFFTHTLVISPGFNDHETLKYGYRFSPPRGTQKQRGWRKRSKITEEKQTITEEKKKNITEEKKALKTKVHLLLEIYFQFWSLLLFISSDVFCLAITVCSFILFGQTSEVGKNIIETVMYIRDFILVCLTIILNGCHLILVATFHVTFFFSFPYSVKFGVVQKLCTLLKNVVFNPWVFRLVFQTFFFSLFFATAEGYSKPPQYQFNTVDIWTFLKGVNVIVLVLALAFMHQTVFKTVPLDSNNSSKTITVSNSLFMAWADSDNPFNELKDWLIENKQIVLIKHERLINLQESRIRKIRAKKQGSWEMRKLLGNDYSFEIQGDEYLSPLQLQWFQDQAEITRLQNVVLAQNKTIRQLLTQQEELNEELEEIRDFFGQNMRKRRFYHTVGQKQQTNLRKQISERSSFMQTVARSYGLKLTEMVFEKCNPKEDRALDIQVTVEEPVKETRIEMMESEEEEGQQEQEKEEEQEQEQEEEKENDQECVDVTETSDLLKEKQYLYLTKNLTQDQRAELQRLVYIIDYYAISNEAYHELAMLFSFLPRSFWVKDWRKVMDHRLDKTFGIENIPGFEGFYQSPSKMISFCIRRFLKQNPHDSRKKFQVKISSDGANMSRQTSLEILSLCLVDSEDSMTAHGTHTIGVVRGSEDYDLLKDAFQKPFEEINKLVENGKIEVDGKYYQLEFFLGGDYKFLALVTGIDSAKADYCCVHCHAHKKERSDMTKNFSTPAMKRSLENIRRNCTAKSAPARMGAKHPPLLNIPLDHVVMDELHIVLRIFDKLLKILINEVDDTDKVLIFFIIIFDQAYSKSALRL